MDNSTDRADPAHDETPASLTPSGDKASCPNNGARVLVGVTGSVAALKLPNLVSGLLQIPGIQVQVVSTERAKHFYGLRDISVPVYSDQDEWEMTQCVINTLHPIFYTTTSVGHKKMWKQRSDPVLHIELRRWANLMVIAPLDANTLGKISSGICDNLLGVSDSRTHRIGLGAMAEVDTIIKTVKQVLSEYQLLEYRL